MGLEWKLYCISRVLSQQALKAGGWTSWTSAEGISSPNFTFYILHLQLTIDNWHLTWLAFNIDWKWLMDSPGMCLKKWGNSLHTCGLRDASASKNWEAHVKVTDRTQRQIQLLQSGRPTSTKSRFPDWLLFWCLCTKSETKKSTNQPMEKQILSVWITKLSIFPLFGKISKNFYHDSTKYGKRRRILWK